ncbi:phage portal protein [Occultella glacieicola]|nr:phage portal protein [Occultella glacieicola]
MGIRSVFDLASRVASGTALPKTTRLASPYAGANTLTKVAVADMWGEDGPLFATYLDAMRVPAIVKGRALIVGTLSRQPLAKFRGSEKVKSDPWMYRTSTAQNPQARMLWTIDDCIMYGSSLWAVQRGSKEQITDAIRVLPDEWELDDDLRIKVRGQKVDADEVILFEGPQLGLLEIAAADIRASIAMGRSWAQRVDSPVPLVALKIEDANHEPTDDEADQLIESWETARRKGGTALLPYGLGMDVHGETPTDLYVNGRNAARLDWANYLALPASLLDGSTATASLTYSTKQDSRNELVDLSLAYWATPIEARLSQDDVVPSGTRTAFDLEYLASPTQPTQSPARED